MKTTTSHKLKLKKGDRVKVTAGNEKGKDGEILRIIRETNRAVVEGVNLRTRHIKPTANNPEGGPSR